MDLGIRGRRAAVAAAGGGLGYACAEALVAEGASVVICDVSEDRAAAAAERLGGGARWLVADLTDPEAAGRFVEEAAAALGGLDILLVNGPGPPPGTVLETPAEAYQAALDRSLLSVVRMCLAAVPRMRAGGWGRIVAITSLGVRQPYPNLALSNTARAGATGFLRTLAREIAADGITVNSVQPGLHATDRVQSVYGDGELLTETLATIPAGRLGVPEELGALVAFLCSAHAGYVTGVAVPVDGGAYQALL
ncbi:SDR family oxidoreductase [Pseudonocardia parietis]|uniref:3-oxoacyl-[acyl-carrier protein] reductase n=1 Tax=Pseudonocardia parietis TaxID=570936 RepID=A0ABS4VRJ2_9PSEU|nr:SDR family oxidoreductase [Pseudonocardia parietis]MBP2366560.1 3-oxoacyl-[acyl-carrier protein] reductase [Pseudonocardia parietis]